MTPCASLYLTPAHMDAHICVDVMLKHKAAFIFVGFALSCVTETKNEPQRLFAHFVFPDAHADDTRFNACSFFSQNVHLCTSYQRFPMMGEPFSLSTTFNAKQR